MADRLSDELSMAELVYLIENAEAPVIHDPSGQLSIRNPLTTLHAEVKHLRAELRLEVAAARQVIEGIEWAKGGQCPACHGWKPVETPGPLSVAARIQFGHHDDCPVGGWLACHETTDG